MHSLKVLHERMEVETIGYCKVSKEESVRCFAERFWAECGAEDEQRYM